MCEVSYHKRKPKCNWDPRQNSQALCVRIGISQRVPPKRVLLQGEKQPFSTLANVNMRYHDLNGPAMTRTFIFDSQSPNPIRGRNRTTDH
eukprot:3012389-Rhodomonas_salina.2